jgi:hypothetical protein
MSEELKKIGEERLATTINNPFEKESITNVFVNMSKLERRGKPYWYCYGFVEFTKGNTTGKQRFDGETFDEVLVKIRNFINEEL